MKATRILAAGLLIAASLFARPARAVASACTWTYTGQTLGGFMDVNGAQTRWDISCGEEQRVHIECIGPQLQTQVLDGGWVLSAIWSAKLCPTSGVWSLVWADIQVRSTFPGSPTTTRRFWTI